MHRHIALLCLFVLFFQALRASAEISAIQANALPQETSILAALDDARQMEPYCASYTPNWKFPVARQEAAAHLERDLGFLNVAMRNHPDNTELLLLTGLVAHYAYNLDVPGTYDIAMGALDHAQKLTPSDVRGPWFQASLLCQTAQPKSGADAFLAIEDSHPWNELPAAFWDDYMACATVTSMPAHVLRAADHLDKLHAPDSEMRDFLAKTARNRLNSFDPKRKYEPKDVWTASNTTVDPAFTSTMCGVRLEAHGGWTINQLGFGNGSCIAYFSTGPYKALTRDLRPSILLLVQQPAASETLQDFLAKFIKGGSFEPFAPSRCPAAACLAMKGVQVGMYKADGDGHGHIIVFERDEPAFPGLIFESPLEPPKPTAAEGLQFYRPEQIHQRVPGKLYYLVLVDTAASIEEPAMKDLNFFLQHLTVE